MSIKNTFDLVKKLVIKFKLDSIKLYTRQEQIVILTNWLNYVNLIKAALFKINAVKQSYQNNECASSKDQNKKYLDTVNNFLGQLVDISQKTIRQQNLNLSLLILT